MDSVRPDMVMQRQRQTQIQLQDEGQDSNSSLNVFEALSSSLCNLHYDAFHVIMVGRMVEERYKVPPVQ
jgi:hypothetical protein